MGASAPLLSAPEAPAPQGGTAEWVEGEGGVRLRAALFPARRPSRGSVVLSPGRTEPIEKYYEVIEELRGRGFTVLAHDWRGQGLSQRLAADPMKGHARGWRPFVGDLGRVLEAFAPRLPSPWFALSHSMGGCLTMLALVEGETRFSAVVVTSPMLGLLTGGPPPALAGLIAGAMTLASRGEAYVRRPAAKADRFEGNILTHDRRRWERTAAMLAAHPDLALGEVTWGWLDFALSAGRFLDRNPAVERIATPIALVAAGEEQLVDNAATRTFAARLPQGRYVELAGARHEILMETDDIRAVFWKIFDETVSSPSA